MKESDKEEILNALESVLKKAGVDYSIEEIKIAKEKADKSKDDELDNTLKSARQDAIDTAKEYVSAVATKGASVEEKIKNINRYIKAILNQALDILKEISDEVGIEDVVVYIKGNIDDTKYCNAYIPKKLETTEDILTFFANMTMDILMEKKYNNDK